MPDGAALDVPACTPVSFDAYGASALFRAYLRGDARLTPFFAHAWTPEAWATTADHAAAYPRDRTTLAEALHRQHDRYGADDEARRGIDLLAEEGTVAVVTGQQLGLFGGPLFTLHKTLTALKLAEAAPERTGHRAAPVFWLHGEDHDYAEVAAALLVGADDEPFAVRYDAAPTASGAYGPVGRLVLTDRIEAVLERTDAGLAGLPYRAETMRLLRTAYVPGRTLTDAFAHLLTGLLPGTGLVLMSADDAALKRLVAPIFRREVEAAQAIADAVHAHTDRLVAAGFGAQLQVTPTNLFRLDDTEGRRAVDLLGDGTFSVRGTSRTYTLQVMLEEVETYPERFSPNAALRPVVQDALLPTLAYVGGPGELAYFAQLRPVYDAHAVPMPVVYPRLSATVLTARARRALNALGLDVPDLARPFDALWQEVAEGLLPGALNDAFASARAEVQAALARLAPALTARDASLERSVASVRTGADALLDRLHQKAVRAEKRRHTDAHTRLRHAHSLAAPGGKAQERSLSLAPLLARFGPALPGLLARALPLDPAVHHVVTL